MNYEICEHKVNAAACVMCENDRLKEKLARCYDRIVRLKGLYAASHLSNDAQKKLNLELRKEE